MIFASYKGRAICDFTRQTNPVHCPYCGKENDRHSGPCGDTAGQLSICVGCLKVGQFVQDGLLIKIEPIDEKTLSDEEQLDVDRVREAIRFLTSCHPGFPTKP